MQAASFGSRAIRPALILSLMIVGYAGDASAEQLSTKFKTSYCTDSSFPAECTKTITIYNNYDYAIYPVIQGTLEQGPGKNCDHGDVWLQAAFGDIGHCYATAHNYLVYVNGIEGIPKHSHA